MSIPRTAILLLLFSLTAAAAAWLAEAIAAETDADATSLHEAPITDADRQHWAFSPLVRPELPEVRDTAWVRNPIDRFILARLEKADLQPAPEADRPTLLRRVTFDLTGLPPTPAEIDAFAADTSPQAYENVVDELLSRRAYGERQAQHWLDLARYAESDGFEHDDARPQAWRYRDWVIDALNHDLPYDAFVRQQVAGDVLHPGDHDASIATGFLIAGPDMPDLNNQDERRHNVLNEIAGSVGSVFLGLQLGCAQCHDHKYDPISQADFYRLRASFESAKLFKPVKMNSPNPDDGYKPDPDERVVTETPGPWATSHLMIRGDFRRPGPELQPAFPRIANPWNDAPPADESTTTISGRRAALAQWLTRGDQPLTTRVIVNRLWQNDFGEGLSRTPSDFGVMGQEPSHPQLLDWLATELVRDGWSLKRLHRLLVTSATYRQASRLPTSATASQQTAWKRSLETDPENMLLARMSRRRLDGEAIRDTMLVVSDRLSARHGGPGVMPALPKGLLVTLRKSNRHWAPSSDEEDRRRRSVYVFVRRNMRFPMFEAFDRPDPNLSCSRRDRSTTAPQALVMLNSEFSLSVARDLAGYLFEHEPKDSQARIALLYRRALGRVPRADELAAAQTLLANQEKLLREEAPAIEPAQPQPPPENADTAAAAALVDLCLALMNTNEFLFLD